MNFRLDNALALLSVGTILPRVLATIVVVSLGMTAARVGRRLVARLSNSPHRRFQSGKVVSRLSMLAVFVVLVFVWAPVQRTVLAGLAVFITAIVLGLREAVLSVVAWLFLLVRAPYRVGDRIEVNGMRGDVVDIHVLHTSLVEVGAWATGDQSTGRLVYVPNNWIFLHGIRNDTHGFGFVWNELAFTLTTDSNVQAAEDILEGLAAEMSHAVETQARRALDLLSSEVLIQYQVLTPFVYVSVGEKGITLTLRYLCEARKRRGTEHALTVSFLQALHARDDVHLVGAPSRAATP